MLKKAQHINLSSSITKPVSASTLHNITLKVMGEIQSKASEPQQGLLDTSYANKIIGAEILLVEDNEINQQIAVELLEMAGLKVTVANNGEIAVQTVENKQFDAVLMDIQMPVMDGYTATRAIRKNEKHTNLPIIAMTANAMSGDREKCLAAGMNDHIPKPINPHEVYKTLAQWVQPTGKVLGKLVKTPEEVIEAGLPDLPEFEVDTALDRMAGNVNAYRKTLKKVSISEADAVLRIREALAIDDFNTAVLIAHTLKGVSATIGASFVVPSAEKLELLFNERIEKGTKLIPEELEPILKACEEKLAQMIATIHEDQKSQQTIDEIKPFDKHSVDELLKELKEQIDCFDTKAGDTFQKIIAFIDPVNLPQITSELSNTLYLYNFDNAEVILPVFEEELSVTVNPCARKNIDNKLLLDKLNAIEGKISNYDSTVVDSVDELLNYQFEALVSHNLEKMRDSLSQYDFDRGEEQLSKIKAHLKI